MQVHTIKREAGHYQVVTNYGGIVVANIKNHGIGDHTWHVYTPGGELDSFATTLASAKRIGVAWADARTFCQGGCGWIIRHPDTHCTHCRSGQTTYFGAN